MSFAEERKECSRCKREKPLSKFGRNATRYDGKQSWCKDCAKLAAREIRQRYKEANAASTGQPSGQPVEAADGHLGSDK
jgi:hypothetical protein